jgi:hypothetical protein
MWRPQAHANIYLWVTVGQLRLIRSREPIHNIGQGKDLHANIHVSLQANSSILEVGSLFKMLANAKACMELFMSDCRPTQAYRKQGAHSQCWPRRRPTHKYSCITTRQLELIKSQEPIHNVGQCKGLHTNTDWLSGANLNVPEARCPFSTLTNAKACMQIFMSRCRWIWAYQKWEPIYNIGQCDAKTDQLKGANLSLSEGGNPFTALANAKACMHIFMCYCGPTQAYRKQGAYLKHWPMQRPAWNYLWVTVGQLGIIRNGVPILNIG